MPFTEEDSDFFFGREEEREMIAANLLSSRLTLLYGPSGVGKSSLLRAGIMVDLAKRAEADQRSLGVPEVIPVIFSSWRDDPVRGLRECIAAAVVRTIGEDSPLNDAGGELADFLELVTSKTGSELTIILDQFEEYFLYHPHEQDESSFAGQFARAVSNRELRVNFLISLREDELAKLDRFEGQIPHLFENYIRVEHLDRDGARRAIVKPIDTYNIQNPDSRVSIEEDLVAKVLSEVAEGRVNLAGAEHRQESSENGDETRVETPYLQLVMVRLWEAERAAKSSTLRLATLQELQGAEAIVRSHLDNVMGTLRPAERGLAAALFRQLVTPSGAKIAHTTGDLAALANASIS